MCMATWAKLHRLNVIIGVFRVRREAISMYTRAIRAALIASVLAIISTCALGEARYRVVERSSAFLITGAATSIDRLREVVEIVDRGSTYRVLTGRAAVQLENGKTGSTQDLKDGAVIQVSGQQLSARTVLASSVVVLDARAAASLAAPQGYRPNDHIEASGAVTGVIASSKEIDVRTDDGNFALLVKPETIIRRYIYVTDIDDVNEGDAVSFIGRIGQDGRVIAERIHVFASGNGVQPKGSKGYRPTYLSAVSQTREDTIEGAIISPPSSFDRSLALDTEYGDRKVDVLKSAEVRIDRLPASVHDLGKGDYVRVIGTWDGDTMIASRVETSAPSSSATYRVQELTVPEPVRVEPAPPPAAAVPVPAAPAKPAPAPPANPPAQPQPEPEKPTTLTGRIVEIDYTNLDLSVDAGLKDNKIDARDAVITREGSTRRFSELKKGDKVEVKGDWNGDVMKAASVDVVE